MHIKYKHDPQEKDGETILSFFKNKRSFGFFSQRKICWHCWLLLPLWSQSPSSSRLIRYTESLKSAGFNACVGNVYLATGEWYELVMCSDTEGFVPVIVCDRSPETAQATTETSGTQATGCVHKHHRLSVRFLQSRASIRSYCNLSLDCTPSAVACSKLLPQTTSQQFENAQGCKLI